MDMEQLIFCVLLLVVFPCLAWGIPSLLSRNKGKMTGHVTVHTHRLELSKVASRWSSNWNHLVTFRLSDGSDLELYTTEAEYHTLEDGQTGLLTWEKDLFYHFDPDIPQ